LLRLNVGGDPTFLDSFFAVRYALQESQPILKGFECGHIHQIGSWDSVLGNEDRRPVLRQFSENFGGIPL